jgi:YD repeat-containing protein
VKYDNDTKKRLQSVTINHESKKLKTASLNYINQFNGKNLFRSFLRSVSVSGEGEYQMEYLGIDSSLPVNAPEEGTLKLDHWGYYNSKSNYLAQLKYNQSGEEVIDERYHQSAPDSTSAKFGMLSKMKWPTGGYTTYTYEANRYDKVVVLDTIYNDKYRIGEAVRDITNKLPSRTVGGLRIKKIENYDKSNVLTGFKEFRYNIGLLCKEPFHVAMFEMVAAPREQLWLFNPGSSSQQMGYPLSGNIKVSGDIMSSDFNQIGVHHIVYPEVTEINADGSYTRYEYLSFLDSELQSFNSEKRAIQSLYGEVLEPNFFAPYEMPMFYDNGLYNRNARVYQKLMWKSSVNDLGFGKPKMITNYNSSNQVVSKKKFEYNLSASKNTLWYPQTPLTGPGGGGRYIGMKPSIAESPLLIKENETLYYNGGITINKQTEYKYNDSHQMIKRIEKSSSSGDVFETNYVYPLNYRVDSSSPNSGGIKTIDSYPSGSGGTMAKKMVEANVVNNPLSVNKAVNSNQMQKIDYTYVQSGNLINLAQITQTGIDGQQVLQTNVEYYDNQGRPLQVRYPDGKVETIVWGYGGRFVAAKIENKTKAQVESLIGSLQNPLVGTLSYQNEKTLRGVSDAYVTTYEYSDGVGITRITQPDGTSVFFVYNMDGKLVGTFDKDGNPVSSVNYNIQN